MRISRTLRISAPVVVAAVLIGCAGDSGSSTMTTHDRAGRTRTASPATNAAPKPGSQDQPLERDLVERLQVADPNAARTGDGFKDAHAEATIAGDHVYIDIPTPGVSRDKVRRIVRYSGIETQAVPGQIVGRGLFFGCRLDGFGDRQVYVSDLSKPRRVTPIVYRLLRCTHAPLGERHKMRS